MTKVTLHKVKRKRGAVWLLRWYTPDGKRRGEVAGECGRMTKRQAQAARRTKQGRLDCKVEHPDRPQRMTLGAFAEHYLERRLRGDTGRGYLKGAPQLDERTIVEHDMTLRYMLEHFKSDRAMTSIDLASAEGFVNALAAGRLAKARRGGRRGLGEQRVRAHLRNAKAILNWARRFGFVDANPFVDFECRPLPTDPNHYVPQADLIRLLRACRQDMRVLHGWRALFGLCRLAGLRRGEALALPWSGKARDTDGREHVVGVDFEHRRLLVMGNSKTRRKYREVPVCPRLYRLLLRAFEAAPAGQATVCGISEDNVTREAHKLVKSAGLERWPKLFQAMRSSCENDWKQTGIAETTYCTWAGHSSKVSREHYVSPTEAEFAAVSGHAQDTYGAGSLKNPRS